MMSQRLRYWFFWRSLQRLRRRQNVGRRGFCGCLRPRARVLVRRLAPLLLLSFSLLLLHPFARLCLRRVFLEYTTYPQEGVYNSRESEPPELRATHRFIALGTPLFGGGNDWPLSSNERGFAGCDEPRCLLLRDPSNADAVVYHSYDLLYFPWILARLWLRSWWSRAEDRGRQKLVLYNLEPPSRWGRHAWLLNGLFDWLASYRADSEVPLRYAFSKLEPINSSFQSTQTQDTQTQRLKHAPAATRRNYAAGRTRLAVIVTSHCHVPSERLVFIHSLQSSLAALQSKSSASSHLDEDRAHRLHASDSSDDAPDVRLARASHVDVLGGCGRACGDCDPSSLARTYKFYLALENARCTDYVSEKFWERGLAHDLVPIVNGGRGARAASPLRICFEGAYARLRLNILFNLFGRIL